MYATMDSPDHKPMVPTSDDDQGSPFFHFLCSLSPIKLVRSGHGTQTNSGLSFPPPPPVFVSPKVESYDTIRSKRKILAGTAETIKNNADPVHPSDVGKEAFNSSQATNNQQASIMVGSSQSLQAGTHKLSTKAIQEPAQSTVESGRVKSQHNLVRHATEAMVGQSSPRGKAGLKHHALSLTSIKESSGQEMLRPSALSASHVKAHTADHFRNDNPAGLYQPARYDTVMDKRKGESCFASYVSKNTSGCWPVRMEGLSRILASLQGVLSGDNSAGSLNSDLDQHKLEVYQDQDLGIQNMNQGCKTMITGVCRRCLDFRTPEMQQDNLLTHGMQSLSSESHSCKDLSSESHSCKEISKSSNEEPSPRTSITSKPLMVWDQGVHPSYSLHTLPQLSEGNELHSHDLQSNIASLEVFRSEKGAANSNAWHCAAKSLTSKSIQGSFAPENNLVPGRNYLHTNYFNQFDQDTLAALVKKATMNQTSIQPANLGMPVPTNCFQNLNDNTDMQGQNNHMNDLDNEISSLLQMGNLLQESSHQSESDQQEDSSHSPRSPRKKRKLSIQGADIAGDGCKNCKCKKSKCLKLYCECFAAGVYCIDICNCRDCYNKPEFEETVLGTRQQIESRNPLAFLPKIIRASDTPPVQGEEINDTPASARHKRGCNCKKSQCLKKYCECYQAGVGCADGCRCEGCKNIYGRNEETDNKDQQTTDVAINLTTHDGSSETEIKQPPEYHNSQHPRVRSPPPYLGNSGQCRSITEMNLDFMLKDQASIILHPPLQILELSEKAGKFGNSNLSLSQAARKDSIPNLHQFPTGWEGQDEPHTKTLPLQCLQGLTADLHDAIMKKCNTTHNLWRPQDCSDASIDSCTSRFTNAETNQYSLMQQVTPLVKYYPNVSQFMTSENALANPVTPLLSTIHAPHLQIGLEESSKPQSNVGFPDNDDIPNVAREINAFSAPNIIRKTRSPQQKRVFSYQQNLNHSSTFPPVGQLRNARKSIAVSLPFPSKSNGPRDKA